MGRFGGESLRTRYVIYLVVKKRKYVRRTQLSEFEKIRSREIDGF
jgi:hypothetical protein